MSLAADIWDLLKTSPSRVKDIDLEVRRFEPRKRGVGAGFSCKELEAAFFSVANTRKQKLSRTMFVEELSSLLNAAPITVKKALLYDCNYLLPSYRAATISARGAHTGPSKYCKQLEQALIEGKGNAPYAASVLGVDPKAIGNIIKRCKLEHLYNRSPPGKRGARKQLSGLRRGRSTQNVRWITPSKVW